MSAAFLASQLPEFDVAAAPGSVAENPVVTDDAAAQRLLPTLTPPAITGKSPSTTVHAIGKPSTLEEAFEKLGFPTDLQEPLLNMVGADLMSDPIGACVDPV